MSSITDFFNKRFTIHLFRTRATGVDKSSSGTQKRLFDRKKGKLLWYIYNPEPEPEPEPVLITDSEPSPGGSIGSPEEPNIGFSPTSSKSPIDPRTSSVEEKKKGSEVSAEIKDSLDSDDQWMQRKKEQENQ